MGAKKTFVILFAIFILCVNCGFVKKENKGCNIPKISFANRIFGGDEVDKEKHEFPWLVALYHRSAKTFFCAGTLISEKHVLSAAHCFKPFGEVEPLEPYEVMCLLGRYSLSDPNEEGSINSLVYEIVIHNEWNSLSEHFHADIAVVVMMDLIEFSDTIKPVGLPTTSFNEVSGIGTVVGWGKSEHSGKFKYYDDKPSKVQIPAVNGSYCYVTFPKLADHSSHGSFCGGYENKGKAPCLGDSGGGFYIKSSKSGVWNVNGIVSGSLIDPMYGCDINKFQLYTNVAKFIDWITKVMKETREIVWIFVNFDCKIDEYEKTACLYDYGGSWKQNLKIKPIFTDEVKGAKTTNLKLQINSFMINGVGESFENLKSLEIASSPIRTLERRHFECMPNLAELTLTSKVERLDEDAFEYLMNLETLQLIWNDEVNSTKLFQNFGKLKKFTLERVPHNFEPWKILKNMKNLVSLNLIGSQIQNLNRSILINLSKLRQLKFESSFTKIVAEDAFQDCRLLEDLSLNNCKFEGLSEKTFWNLKKLRKLSLSSTELKSIPSQIFCDLTSLEELDLSHNLITSLHGSTFGCLANLKQIRLHSNQLDKLPAELFVNNLKLEVVQFSANLLSVIEVDFTRLTKLRVLELDHNTCIKEWFVDGRSDSTVPSVRELQNKIRSHCI